MGGAVRIMTGGDAFARTGYRPDFLLNEFAVPRVAVPRTIEGLASVGKWDHSETTGEERSTMSVRLPGCGGVSIGLPFKAMRAMEDTTGHLPRVATAVLDPVPHVPCPGGPSGCDPDG